MSGEKHFPSHSPNSSNDNSQQHQHNLSQTQHSFDPVSGLPSLSSAPVVTSSSANLASSATASAAGLPLSVGGVGTTGLGHLLSSSTSNGGNSTAAATVTTSSSSNGIWNTDHIPTGERMSHAHHHHTQQQQQPPSNLIHQQQHQSNPLHHQPNMQHQLQYQFLQDDINSYQNGGHSTLEQSLSALSPEQQQQLLIYFQHQWSQQQQQQQFHSLHSSLGGMRLPQNAYSLSSNNTNTSSLDVSSLMNLTTDEEYIHSDNNDATVPRPSSMHPSSNQQSFSISQDLFGEVTYSSGSVSNDNSNSLHHSSSDLGTRSVGYPMSHADMARNNITNIPDASNDVISKLYMEQQLGQITVPNTSRAAINQSNNNDGNRVDETFVRTLRENSTKGPFLTSMHASPETLSLDNTELLTSGQEVSGFGMEDLQRAPGTPLSHTPPPKASKEAPSSIQRSDSLKNQINRELPVNTATSHNNGNKSNKRNKKQKQPGVPHKFQQQKQEQQQQENPPVNNQKQKLHSHAAMGVSQQHSSKNFDSPPQNFSFYSSDQNIILEKMGSLSSTFVNWISADKSRMAKPNGTNESKENLSVIQNDCNDSINKTETVKVPVTKTLSATTSASSMPKAKAGLSSKLSYSDVLNKCKMAASEKATNGNFDHSNFSSQSLNSTQSADNNGSMRKSKYFENHISPYRSPMHFSSTDNQQSLTSNRKTPASNSIPSPTLGSKKRSSSTMTTATTTTRPSLVFGSKVGLDEFTYPTLEELALKLRLNNNNSSNLSSNNNSSASMDVVSTVVTNGPGNKASNAATPEQENSQQSTPAHSTHNTGKKNRGAVNVAGAASATSNAILNNNNKVSNQKQSLKKSSFINNLSETNSSTSGSKTTSSTADNSTAGVSSVAAASGDSSDSSNADTAASASSCVESDDSNSEKDLSRTPSTPAQSSPQHSRTNLRSHATGGTTSRYRSSGGTTTRAGGGSGSKGKNGSNKKKKDNAVEWKAHLHTLLQLMMTYALLASNWLYDLVSEVLEMSTTLLCHCWSCAVQHCTHLTTSLWAAVKYYWNKFTDRIFKYWRPKGSKKRYSRSEGHYLEQHIVLPATGDEAMKRLLACRTLDNYSILGVTPDATQEDIRKYYRRQAFLVHPDKNKTPGAEEAFKVLGHAFEEVGEPAKREAYDKHMLGESQLGEAWDKLSELLKDLERKLEEAANMIRCTSCNNKHKRVKVDDRPVYAARYCAQCNIRHAAKEGDIWAESWYYGLRWQYFACMDGGVYNISEWAACQSSNLKQLKANTHAVQYRIVAGKKKPPSREHHQQQQQQHRSQQQQHELPSEPEIEEFFNQLYREKFTQNFPQSSSSSSHPSGADNNTSTPTTTTAANTSSSSNNNNSSTCNSNFSSNTAAAGNKRRDHRNNRRNRRQ